MKDYKVEYTRRNEPINVATQDESTLCFKCNENTSKNGSIKIPYNPVYLRRNLKKVLAAGNSSLDTKADNENVKMENTLHSNFSHKNLRINFRKEKEDRIVRKRQKISEEAELETDIINAVKTQSFIASKFL
mmetsp:Transcript_33348/g.32805  ORF Transcript_33348/g.32805 Transcript_33348/m.32805 type:complete len:132 (+) Transcript_33348:2913-3308(+)